MTQSWIKLNNRKRRPVFISATIIENPEAKKGLKMHVASRFYNFIQEGMEVMPNIICNFKWEWKGICIIGSRRREYNSECLKKILKNKKINKIIHRAKLKINK